MKPTKMRPAQEGGTRMTSSPRGNRIKEGFGADTSDVKLGGDSGRGGKVAGGTANLSHSLNGSNANQKGSGG